MSSSKKHRRTKTRGALVVIASLLVGSALLRMGETAGQALALENRQPESRGAAEVSDLGPETTEDDLKPMLEAFQARETQIARQEDAIRNRMQALRVAEEEINKKLAALTKAEDTLRATIAFAETASEEDLARLTKVYEVMKPKQAAALFEEMTPEFAAGFLARMRPEASAAIMAGLSPKAAHSFSVVLAGRNADVPNQ